MNVIKTNKNRFLIILPLLFIISCSTRKPAIPDLSATKRVEICYYKDSLLLKDSVVVVDYSSILAHSTSLDDLKPSPFTKCPVSGTIKYYYSSHNISYEFAFSSGCQLYLLKRGSREIIQSFNSIKILDYIDFYDPKRWLTRAGRSNLLMLDHPFKNVKYDKEQIITELLSYPLGSTQKTFDCYISERDFLSKRSISSTVNLSNKDITFLLLNVDSITNGYWAITNNAPKTITSLVMSMHSFEIISKNVFLKSIIFYDKNFNYGYVNGDFRYQEPMRYKFHFNSNASNLIKNKIMRNSIQP